MTELRLRNTTHEGTQDGALADQLYATGPIYRHVWGLHLGEYHTSIPSPELCCSFSGCLNIFDYNWELRDTGYSLLRLIELSALFIS